MKIFLRKTTVKDKKQQIKDKIIINNNQIQNNSSQVLENKEQQIKKEVTITNQEIIEKQSKRKTKKQIE